LKKTSAWFLAVTVKVWLLVTEPPAVLTVYLRFPREHWNRIRHCNFIERTFGETRRRVKVIGGPTRRTFLLVVGGGGAGSRLGGPAWVYHDTGPAAPVCRIYAAACMTRQPNCHNGIRQNTPKAACRQPNPLPPHRVMTISERNLRQATFTPPLDATNATKPN
jgi:hypothetical protein